MESTQNLPAEGAAPAAWHRPEPRVRRHAKGVGALVRHWRGAANFSLAETLPATSARRVALPDSLPAALRRALEGAGQGSLYVHQAEAYRAARLGRHVVVATPTASGKSLAYHLPVLEALLGDAGARALYLFPTKALCRDQEASLSALLEAAGMHHGLVTYDGDTPGDVRRKARDQGAVVMTNPDMLHSGILPHHTSWSRFFAGLRYVVLDELHTLRGVYGSHMANVLRRLLRVAAFHGARPTVLMASATIGNAQEHASALLGQPVVAVTDNGAAKAAQHVFVYNPPVVHPGLQIRQGMVKATEHLVGQLLRAQVSTLVFAQTRASVEVILKYLRDLAAQDPELSPDVIHSYRGGYLPSERRRIEQNLRDGKIRCVVATQALELGIDIGCLDAVVCAGYPGSMAGLWQRFGRGGRRGNESIAVLVASSAPVDQYVAKQAHALLQAPIEHARIDADNVEIVLQHLKCAAFELPFQAGDRFGSLSAEGVEDGLGYLCEHQVLHKTTTAGGHEYRWRTGSYPAADTSLRSIGWDNFVVIDQEHDKTIAEMDWRSTHTMLHEQAIYQHAVEQWQGERIDYYNRKAFVRRVAPDYYTEATTHLKISPLEVAEERRTAGAHVVRAMGEISVVEKVVGFKKIRYHSHDNVGFGEIYLPEMQMHTTAVSWTLLPEAFARLEADWGAPRAAWVDALRGLGHAVRTVAAIGLMVDVRDLGQSVEEGVESSAMPFSPTLYLFDRMPGGVGLADRAFAHQAMLWRQVETLLAHCACDAGCPSCLGAPEDRGIAQVASRRTLALTLLRHSGLLEAGGPDAEKGRA
jgi:DEAD/DEAH box helicase domain-containing protein